MNTSNTTISVDSGNQSTVYKCGQSLSLLYAGMGIGVVLSIMAVFILRGLKRFVSTRRGPRLNPTPQPPPPKPVPLEVGSGWDDKWIKLVQAIVDLGDYVNDMNETVDDDQKGLLKFFYGRLDDVLASNGVTPIKSDVSFSILRHVDESYRDVPDGSRIVDTMVQGWVVGDKVLRRAKVRVVE